MIKPVNNIDQLNLKEVLSEKRLVGLWRLISGYQRFFIIAIAAQGFSAYAKSLTYLLLSFFVDNHIVEQEQPFPIWMIAAGFVLFAGLQGLFTYISGRFAARTAESTVQRLCNFI